MNSMSRKRTPVCRRHHRATLTLSLHSELRRLIEGQATQRGVGLSDYMRGIMADHFGRPELAAPPKVKMGRPRKRHLQAG